jgi:copper oxidase (laccase) domain-containing protein
VIARVRELPVDWQSIVRADAVAGQYYLDLFGLNHQLLIRAGLMPERIFSSRLCTMDDPKLFYSHRRDHGVTGRLVGSIGLIDGENAGFPAVDREVVQQTRGDGDESIVG